VPIASRSEKQGAVEALKRSNTKYAKPFDSGEMALFSVLGGNWEEYAAIVMDMVTADTMLELDERQEKLIDLQTQLLAEQRLTNRLLKRQIGLTEEDYAAEVEASQTATRQELKVRAAKKVRPAQITPEGQVDLKPAVIKILQQQSAQGDEQATEALRIRGLLEDEDQSE